MSTFIFFAAYHFYTSPYQSLIADVTPPDSHGKVQGYQSFMRGGGMFMGMVVAGMPCTGGSRCLSSLQRDDDGVHVSHGRQDPAAQARAISPGAPSWHLGVR